MSKNIIDSVTPETPQMLGLIDHTVSQYRDFHDGATLHDNSPGFVFGAVPGNTYSLYDNGALIGTMVATEEVTNWIVPDLQIGAHVLTVTATDAAGNTSAAAGVHITIDAYVPPTPAIVGFIDHTNTDVQLTNILHDSTPEILFWSVPGNTYSFYDNGTLIGTMVATQTSTNWSVPAMKNGAHTLTLTTTDVEGRTSASAGVDVTVAVPLPATPHMLGLIDHTVSQYADFANGSTLHDSSPGFLFGAVPGNTYSLYDNGALIGTMVATVEVTNWIVPDLQIGAHVLTVTAADAAGNISAAAGVHFTVAAYVPATPEIGGMIDHSLTDVQVTSILHDSTPEIFFRSVPGNTYSFYDNGALIGTMVAAQTSTNWSVPAMKNGAHTLTLTTTDVEGRTSAAAGIDFTVAVPLPATPYMLGLIDHTVSQYVDFGYGATLHDNSPGFVFGAVPGNTYSLYDNGVLIGTMVATQAVTNWIVPALRNGAHVLSVMATDAAGNNGAKAGMDFTVDVSLPATPVMLGLIDHSFSNYLDFNAGATLHDSTPGVVFTSVPGNMYSLYDNGALIGTMVATDSMTNWTVPVDLKNGAHVLTVTATDAAGHTSAAGTTNFTVDVSAPSGSVADAHFAVGLHDAFIASGDHQTADLNADPAVYFKQSTAHIAGGDTGMHTLHLTGNHEVLDLTSLTGSTAAAKISGIETIDLGGHSNSLNLSLVDVLNLGQTNLFQNDGNKQMIVNGSNGDTVDLLHAKVAGITDTDWQSHGTAAVGGVTYNVYEHAGAHTELLIQQSVQVVVH